MFTTTAAQESCALTKSVNIDQVLAQRDAYARSLNAAAVAMRNAGMHGDVRITLDRDRSRKGSTHHWPDQDAVDEMLRRHDAAAWWNLLKDTGLYSFLDAEGRETWKRTLETGEHPAVLEANVVATFQLLNDQRSAIFERGVTALFRSLSWDYRTNSPRRFGKRLVITHAVEHLDYVSFRFANTLDDLIRVMSIIDKKPEPDSARAGAYRHLQSLGWPKKANNITIADLVQLRGFKNGNCHLTFLRLDVVEEMNRILARNHPNALPPAD